MSAPAGKGRSITEQGPEVFIACSVALGVRHARICVTDLSSGPESAGWCAIGSGVKLCSRNFMNMHFSNVGEDREAVRLICGHNRNCSRSGPGELGACVDAATIEVDYLTGIAAGG